MYKDANVREAAVSIWQKQIGYINGPYHSKNSDPYANRDNMRPILPKLIRTYENAATRGDIEAMNRVHAVMYALKYHEIPRAGATDLTNSGGDCTNFSIQVVEAGGGIWGLSDWKQSTTRWGYADALMYYLTAEGYHGIRPKEFKGSMGAKYLAENGNVRIGDLIFFKDNDGDISHAAIVSDVRDGDIFYAGRTNNRTGNSLSDAMESYSIAYHVPIKYNSKEESTKGVFAPGVNPRSYKYNSPYLEFDDIKFYDDGSYKMDLKREASIPNHDDSWARFPFAVPYFLSQDFVDLSFNELSFISDKVKQDEFNVTLVIGNGIFDTTA